MLQAGGLEGKARGGEGKSRFVKDGHGPWRCHSYFYWHIVDLQCYVSFRCTTK